MGADLPKKHCWNAWQKKRAAPIYRIYMRQNGRKSSPLPWNLSLYARKSARNGTKLFAISQEKR